MSCTLQRLRSLFLTLLATHLLIIHSFNNPFLRTKEDSDLVNKELLGQKVSCGSKMPPELCISNNCAESRETFAQRAVPLLYDPCAGDGGRLSAGELAQPGMRHRAPQELHSTPCLGLSRDFNIIGTMVFAASCSCLSPEP